jgi:hypothetical protein
VQLEQMDATTLSRTLVKVSKIASGRSMGSDGPPVVHGQNTYNTQSSYTSQDEQDEVDMLFSKMSPVRCSLSLMIFCLFSQVLASKHSLFSYHHKARQPDQVQGVCMLHNANIS